MRELELCLSVTVRTADRAKCTLILRQPNSSLLFAISGAVMTPSAAEWYMEGFTKRSGIQSKVEISPLRLSKEAELVFFRVLQESLTNVLRHSGSTAVDVRLYSDGENAVLSVKDYGKGIPLDKLDSFHQTGAGVGVGLGGMRQRVRQLGGHLRVESAHETGTCVTATLPLAKTENPNDGPDYAVGETALGSSVPVSRNRNLCLVLSAAFDLNMDFERLFASDVWFPKK